MKPQKPNKVIQGLSLLIVNIELLLALEVM